VNKDYYKILGLDKSASAEQIKKAYRKLAATHHPDKTGGDDSKFKEITEAYEILSDATKKSQYDNFGTTGDFGGGQPGQGGFGGFDFDFSGGFNVDLNDILGSFFGGGFGRISPIEIAIAIDFMEAALGTEKEISLRVLDMRTNNRVSEAIKIKIPAGINDAQTIRIDHKGNIGKNGDRGDVYVQIRVREDKRFNRRGSDLISEVTIGMTDAALGKEIKIEGLTGSFNLKIPAGTQPEQIIKVSGRGIVKLNSRSHGDHLVVVHVNIPTNLSSKQVKALEDFTKIKKGFW
jgi:DnaJ-class molecular chaperone